MQYPLKLKFKILAIAPQIFITDAAGTNIFYIKQKLFKLKEDIGVFTDSSQSEQVYGIKADRIIDFSARYNFTNMQGENIGSVKREGMRSFWKASYKVFEGDREVYHIQEESAWVKVLDSIAGEYLGFITNYILNPAYLVKRIDTGEVVMKLKKEPAFFEGVFSVEKMDQNLDGLDERRILLALMMVTLLERSRG